MRPDKPQFWTGEGAGVNLAMTEITRPSRWEPIKNLTERTLVDVNIDCRGMLQGKLNIIQDEIVINTINNPIQKNIIVTPSQSLSFETIGIGTYDISSAIFSKLVFTFTPQNHNNPFLLIFNNDGTRLYMLTQPDDNIFEYNLTTPYDISTATFSRIALSVGAQDNISRCIIFNNDGTRLYMLGSGNDNIYQYNLTTPYDISTATFSRIALSVGAQDTEPRCMIFNNDGTRLYMLGITNDNIFEYNLTTPYDISTATFSRIALSVGAQDSILDKMIFNNDGTRLYMLGITNDNIFEYNLTTPYDISTATFSRIALNLTPQAPYPTCIIFNNDGTRLYVLNIATLSTIYEYRMGFFENAKIRTLTN